MNFLIKRSSFFIVLFLIIFSFPIFCSAVEKKTPYQTILIKQNLSNVKVDANKEISFEVKFKNTGTATWYNNGSNYLALNTTDPSERKSVFYCSSWPHSFQSAKMQEKKVAPGKTGTFKFTLCAPNIFESKKYIEKFRLISNDLALIEGKGIVTISIDVKGAPKPKEEPKKEIESNNSSESKILSPKSDIRADLYSFVKPNDESNQKVSIIFDEGYEVKNQDGVTLLKQPIGNEIEVEFNFKFKKYYLNINGTRIINTDSFLRFYPNKGSEGFSKIINNGNISPLISNIQSDKFRGILEIKHNQETDRILITNEFSEKYKEYYLKQAENNFDPNNLISDYDFTNYNSMTLQEIQKFLEINGSYLANYIIPLEENVPFCYKGQKRDTIKIPQQNAGKTIAQAIFDESQEHQINPQVILTTIQKESSAITTKEIPTDKRLIAWLLGYGKNDAYATCTYSLANAKSQAEYGGIGNQIAYAIAGFQKTFSKGIGPQKNGTTYKVGDTIILSDAKKNPLPVSLTNKATASLYRYTPFVYNGNYNFWKIYQDYSKNQSYRIASI